MNVLFKHGREKCKNASILPAVGERKDAQTSNEITLWTDALRHPLCYKHIVVINIKRQNWVQNQHQYIQGQEIQKESINHSEAAACLTGSRAGICSQKF